MRTAAAASVREYAPADLEAYVDVTNRAYPDYAWTAEEVRHEDETWEHERFFKLRLVSEDAGRVVGVAQANHSTGQFSPDTYWVDVTVDPDLRGRGHGTALYDRLLEALAARGARALRAAAKESMTDGVRFAERRGFSELKRDWESRLDVAGFDEAPFASAYDRIAEQGVTITTLAAEMAKDRDGALRKAYELREALRLDVPSTDPQTPRDFASFLTHAVEAPTALHDAYFIAVDRDGAYVGNSDLWASLNDTSFLWQGLTGVRREARGRGIAMALKLETVRYARAHGKREIKTWNDIRNRPMLRINEALGFVKQPAWIAYGKELAAP